MPNPSELTPARSGRAVADALRALDAGGRVDLVGAPSGVVAHLLAKRARATNKKALVVTPDGESARSLAQDLGFHLGSSAGVLVYPASDITPYLEVASDRRAQMDRLAVLFHLAHGLDWSFLVLSGPSLLRKSIPLETIRKRSAVVRVEGELDRDAFLALLSEGGYLKTPVAEDPGTFATRGGLIDVFPPHEEYPVRIELDDYLVMSLRRFDPENQRTLETVPQVFVHPVRDTLLGKDELARAKTNVRDLCDAVDLPTSKTKKILEDIESGRPFYGIDGFLPAFFETLSSVFDYVAADTEVVLSDPLGIAREVEDELGRARADLDATLVAKKPAYPLERHYLSEEELAEAVLARPLAVAHRMLVGGAASEEEGPLAALSSADPSEAIELGGEDQKPLVLELAARRESRAEDSLDPLATRARDWLEHGFRVFFAARTQAQAERLRKLLKNYDLPLESASYVYGPSVLGAVPAGRAAVVIGGLADGFVLASEGLAYVTEEEIFGARARRRERARKKSRDRTEPFLEDLRELQVGDFVVHVDHGIGRYLGLERKVLGQSQFERMRGQEAASVEVLVVEYTGGDKLFLPVTRLHQIQKFSGKEGHAPKLDRLGGQTFDKTKARVRERVQQLAAELLHLYAERAAREREPLDPVGREYEEFEATFPFEETSDQARAIGDVLDDLEKGRPMDRVVCGDVGFGKTEVALRAAFRSALAGRQVAMLCPTTVLAQQHFHTFTDRFHSWPIVVKVLSRFVEKKAQDEIVAGLKEGKVDVVIGTHRLLSKDVHFKNLGLLVVDEEQRFGVAHKERIKRLRTEVDVLTLSATPIPRTLQMAIGGLRDLSLITTPPTDRRAVRTYATRWDDHVVREAVRRELARSGQVFFVYNRIDGLYERANRLQELVPEARLAVAHGQMPAQALERLMTDFVDGRYDILCSTAIVESGLDIPRANTILIDRADIFGLAQLYQLRGRVGRSKERAYCYLITPPPSQMTDEARYRIEALERFTELGSGFHVASLDMEQRGAGDILGVEQSGMVAQVGFDLFVHLLEQAVAELRGEPIVEDVDPEMTFDLEWYVPDTYVEDVGLRLSFYKRLAQAADEEVVAELGSELEDRFGAPPPPAQRLLRAMALKPALRELRVLGVEGSPARVTLHFKNDTPIDPAKLLPLVTRDRAHYKITPDMRLTKRFDDESSDAIARVEELLRDLRPLVRRD